MLQVGRENPSELKAAKLARSMAPGVEDRDLKPNTQERQQIEAVIVGPPNRFDPQNITTHNLPAEGRASHNRQLHTEALSWSL